MTTILIYAVVVIVIESFATTKLTNSLPENRYILLSHVISKVAHVTIVVDILLYSLERHIRRLT